MTCISAIDNFLRQQENFRIEFQRTNLEKFSGTASMAAMALANGSKIFLFGDAPGYPVALHAWNCLMRDFLLERPALPAILTGPGNSLNAQNEENLVIRQLESLSQAGDIFINLSLSEKTQASFTLLSFASSLGLKIISVMPFENNFSGIIIKLPAENSVPGNQALALEWVNLFCMLLDRFLFECPGELKNYQERIKNATI